MGAQTARFCSTVLPRLLDKPGHLAMSRVSSSKIRRRIVWGNWVKSSIQACSIEKQYVDCNSVYLQVGALTPEERQAALNILRRNYRIFASFLCVSRSKGNILRVKGDEVDGFLDTIQQEQASIKRQRDKVFSARHSNKFGS